VGKYITFIDGDDVWSLDRLKSHLNFMELNRVNFSHTSYSFIDQDSNEIKSPFIVKDKELSYEDLLKRPEISCLTAMYNQEALGKMYMSNHRAKQDYALWLSILKGGTKCYPFKQITGFYRQHSSSNTSSKLSLIFPHILFLKETQGFGMIKSIYYTLHWGLNGLIKYKLKKILTKMINKKFIKASFTKDLKLLDNLKLNNMLMIGGAGTIGSSYIKQILKYKPSKITVVDINENGLTELTRDLRSSNLLDYNPEYITYPVNLLSDTFDKILILILGKLLQIFQLISMCVQKKIKFLWKL
jgi:hypothetical protein